jgi:hypothetical protein
VNIPREFEESDEALSHWEDFGPPVKTSDLVLVVVGFAFFVWVSMEWPGHWFI